MTALLEAKPPQAQKHEEDDFVVLRNVPVWKEHTNREGVHFGPSELRQVCDRCNERIEDTDDFCPVVLRHTTDDGDRDPKVIGFAGPFHIGTIGRLKPKAAILATLRIYREDQGDLKRYPRLSVEYWADEDDPTHGYFDPISLLGAETPELDLSVRYSKDSGARGRVMRYSKVTRFEATAPGGSNTFIAGGTNVDKKKTPKPYAKGESMLDEQDLAQIAAALKPMVEEAVHTAVAELNAPENEGADDLTPYGKLAQYMSEGDDDGADEFYGGLEDDDLAGLSEELDTDEDDDRREQMTAYMARYSCQDDDGEDDKGPEKYKKQRDDLRQKYQREVAKHRATSEKLQAAESQLQEAAQAKRKAVRYQKLQELAGSGYVLDADEELAETDAMSDDLFESHCDRIVSKYQRVPLGTLKTPRSPVVDGNSPEAKADELRQRYAKQAGQNVMRAREDGKSLDYAAELKRLLDEHKDEEAVATA